MTRNTGVSELEARVTRTLRAKAEHVVVADPTDVAVPAVDERFEVVPVRRHRVLVTAGVVAGLVGAVASVAWLRSGSENTTVATRGAGEPSATTTAPVTDPSATTAGPGLPSDTGQVLVPDPPGDGLRLLSKNAGPAGPQTPMVATQLFGNADGDGALGAAVLLEMQVNPPGGQVGGAAPVRVRGVDGFASPSKDAGDAPFEIAWVEGEWEMRATVRGLSQADALALLDSLAPRDGDLQNGFDLPRANQGISLLGEQAGPLPPGRSATFEYGPGDGSVAFTVGTSTAYSYPGYLRTWMAAGRSEADGTVVEWDPGAGAIVGWPDGRQTFARAGTIGDEERLVRVARHAALLSASEFEQLEQ